MKIGIDIRLIGKKRTGDETVFFNLVKNLAKLDSQNEYLLFTDVTDKTALGEISEKLGIEAKENFKIVPLKKKNKFTWNFWTLPRHLRKNPVDVYHTQYITPWFVPKSTKIVTIIHDISFNFFPQFIKFSDLFFLKILIPLSLRRADKIVAVSQFTKDEIVGFYKTDPEKVEVVHNAVPKEWLESEVSAENLEAVRKKYVLPEKFVLYVGTLQPRKNIVHLIEAFARIKKERGLAGFRLVIGGNKKAHNFDKRIDQAIADGELQEDVLFPGFIDEEDKWAIFHLAHVFAFPSLYEGFGIPVLEAMGQGVPVICSGIPALKEIADGGALYFDTASLDDFSKKLYDICVDDNLRNGLIRAGKARVGFFSWKNAAQKTLELYAKLSQG